MQAREPAHSARVRGGPLYTMARRTRRAGTHRRSNARPSRHPIKHPCLPPLVIRGRRFDAAHKFLPDGLSLADAFTTLSPDERRFVSQIQGRTYANIFGLVERFINAKVLELGRDHALGDQEAVEALVRFGDEE